MNKRTNKPIYDVFPRKAPFFGRFLVDEVYPFGFAFISTLRFARVVDELRSFLPFASLGWSMNFVHLYPSLRSGGR